MRACQWVSIFTLGFESLNSWQHPRRDQATSAVLTLVTLSPHALCPLSGPIYCCVPALFYTYEAMLYHLPWDTLSFFCASWHKLFWLSIVSQTTPEFSSLKPPLYNLSQCYRWTGFSWAALLVASGSHMWLRSLGALRSWNTQTVHSKSETLAVRAKRPGSAETVGWLGLSLLLHSVSEPPLLHLEEVFQTPQEEDRLAVPEGPSPRESCISKPREL